MTDERLVHNQIFDGFRALAILLVVFFHVNFGLIKLLPADALQQHIDQTPALFNISWHALGSEVIFFISGYLLTMILLLERGKHGRIDVRAFYIKRVARILPLYYVALLLYSLNGDYSAYEWLLNLLFISKFAGEATIIPVGWSLELQMQFFLLVPLLVIALQRSGRPMPVLLVSLVVLILLRYQLLAGDADFLQQKFADVVMGASPSQAQKDSYYLIHYRASALVIGMILAYLYVDHREALANRFRERGSMLMFSLLGCLLVVLFGFLPTHDAGSFFYTELSDTIYIWYMTLERSLFIVGVCLLMLKLLFSPGMFAFLIPALGNRAFRVVSNSIYPIYLFHFPFVLLAFVLVYWTTDREMVTSADTWQLLALMLVSAVTATAFSWVVHRYIELPLQTRIRNRLLADK